MLHRDAIVFFGALTLAACSHLEDDVELGADLPFAALAPAFSLVTWNVGKGRYSQDKKTTATDLAALLDLHDIGCIQEFVPSLAPQAKGVYARSHQWWFGEEPSGVASISNAEPTSVRAISSTWAKVGLSPRR